MKQEVLWSLRLGFSRKQAEQIKTLGIETFLEKSFAADWQVQEPACFEGVAKTQEELKKEVLAAKEAAKEGKKLIRKEYKKVELEFKAWWLQRMSEAEFPLHEKMNLFWHNHFVSTFKSVKFPYWIYQQYLIINQHSLGNFKEMTKAMMYSNAMLKYLSNNKNKNGKINENLGRELLELFTLGEGHYTESDIKNTALSLAGLTTSNQKGEYKSKQKNNDIKSVFWKKGNFIIDDVIDIIFEQKNVQYFVTEKILKWFVYDNQSKDLVKKYGDKFREYNFEIKPFLAFIFKNEYTKNTAGSQIKSPLIYAFQVCNELNINNISYVNLASFIKNQGMDLFDQPSVKGWEGGKTWLSTQIYLSRNQLANILTSQSAASQQQLINSLRKADPEATPYQPHIQFDTQHKAKEIIKEMADNLIFECDDALKNDMSNILKYDFNPKDENAEASVFRLFNFLIKTPEFQLI
ncbi:Protein of unknown function [Flexibacter flexilis DSM 6793]|uniref:DUF1800 domain-containing protein n=1 Tax=Flexibacter flexilis DSM 6793 TaxID=927664 RepID=A0A1I1H7K9_9BACT|nr:DUF1800 family protein [Flexibacter flexilis]SFC19572.1 Protein of unknown function [Flexibacter flexilis DSM 6793]